MTEENIVVGQNFESPVPLPGYPRETLDDNGWQRWEKFHALYDVGRIMIPRVGTTNEDGKVFKRAEITATTAHPGVYEFTLVWGEFTNDGASWNGFDNRAGVTCHSQVIRTEKPITEHPGWAALADPKNPKEESKKQQKLHDKYKTFTVINVIFRKTTIIEKSKLKYTQALIAGNVNAIEAPPEIIDADKKRWKKIENEIRWTKGEMIEHIEAWQYDINEWEKSLLPTTDLDEFLGTF